MQKVRIYEHIRRGCSVFIVHFRNHNCCVLARSACVSCSGERWAAQLEQEALAVLDASDTLGQTPDDVADAESTSEVLVALRAHVQTCVRDALAAHTLSQSESQSQSTAAASADAHSSPPARVDSPPHAGAATGAARNSLRSAVESRRLYVRLCCYPLFFCL